MAAIHITEAWHGDLPQPLIRWDLAWQLFLPNSPGDLPKEDGIILGRRG